MSGRYFFDTNVLIYMLDGEDPKKQSQAQELIAWGVSSGLGTLSYQVIQEWFNFALRRAARKLSVREAETIYYHLLAPMWKVQSGPELLDLALTLQREGSYAWYDSLILAGAVYSKSKILYSEDFQDGLRVRGVEIRNPFR